VSRRKKTFGLRIYHMIYYGKPGKGNCCTCFDKEAIHDSTVASNVLGIVYRDMENGKALREFQRAIDLPVVPAAPDLANASQALMIMGRFEEAKKYLTNGGRKDP